MIDIKVDVQNHTVEGAHIIRLLGELLAGQDVIKARLAFQQTTLEELMSKADDIQNSANNISDGVASIGSSLSNVAADIERIKAQVVGGLTADEADAVIGKLTTLQDNVTAVATAASNLAASNPEPPQP